MAINFSARFDHCRPLRRRGADRTADRGIAPRLSGARTAPISDLQQAQRKLIEQEKMASLGRLVAGVAHELNNPISFVYGNVHVLDRYRQESGGLFRARRAATTMAGGG